jgi:hypothetical protein
MIVDGEDAIMNSIEREPSRERDAQHVRRCTVELSVRGTWTTVPALDVGGDTLIAKGKLIRVAEIHAEEWLETGIRNPHGCIEALKSEHGRTLRADIFSFSERIPVAKPTYEFLLDWESMAVARVASFKGWWDSLPQESRKNVRRAEKRGVIVEVRDLDDRLVEQIVDVNNDSAVRQNTTFVHYGKSFDQVKRDQSTFLDRSDFICAYLGEELIGLLKLVYRQRSAAILQMLPKASRQDARPANALLAKAIELCEQKQVEYLIYGKYRYGNQGMTSLGEFKKRNGFVEVLVPRYFVPLTMKGRVGMALGIHHELVRILPRSVVRLGRRARARWHVAKRNAGVAQLVEQPKT